MARYVLVLIGFLGIALVAAPAPSCAQTGPSRTQDIQAQVAELDAEIAELEGILHKIEQEGHVVLATRWGGALIDRDQATSLFVTVLLQGRVTANYATEYAKELRMATRIYLNDHIKPRLEEARRTRGTLLGMIGRGQTPATPTSSAPAGEILWPVPMDWTKVIGAIRGSYLVQCSYDGDPMPPDRGAFRLEFVGNGRLAGTYENDRVQWPVSGWIGLNGDATGEGFRDSESFRWTASFGRSGNKLLMRSHTLQVTSNEPDVKCEPGYMRQE